MAFLRFLLWTACAVGLGVFLATWRTGGRTPVEHAQGAWERSALREGGWRDGAWKDGAWKDGAWKDGLREAVPPEQLDRLQDGAEGVWERVKAAASALAGPSTPAASPQKQAASQKQAAPKPAGRGEAPSWAPAERHTPEDRRALQRLVSERAGGADPAR